MATTPYTPPVLEPVVASASTKANGFLARIFNRHFLHISVLIVLPLLMAQPLHRHIELLRDPDIWWHLANARLLFSTHHFVGIDTYSFTVSGQRWVNPEWLAEVPYWLGYRAFHYSGVYLVTWIALALNVVFLYWRGYLTGKHSGAAFWATCLGLALMSANGGPRTILFAYLALSAELAIIEAMERDNARIAWLLPPLFCVWINLHGSWLIGLALLVVYIACGSVGAVSVGAFEQPRRPGKEYKRLFLVVAASLVALMVNPYGWRLVWEPIDMIMNQKLNIAFVEEWQPLRLEWGVGKAAFAVIGLMVLTNCLKGRKWKLYEMVFVFFAWYAAFDHVRFTCVAAIITIPLLAECMARSFCSQSDSKSIPLSMTAFVLACSFVFAFHTFPRDVTLREDAAILFPQQTIGTINPSWRTFNEVNLGGYMAFTSKLDYIDSRLDTFEHHGILKDYIDVIQINQPLAVLDRYRIDHVLFLESTPLTYLLERADGWHVVQHEGSGKNEYVLLVRDTATH